MHTTAAAPAWSPTIALGPGLAIISSFTYALYTLACPLERYNPRNFAIIVLLVAIYFHRFDHLSPDHQLNIIFAHALLLWLLHLIHILFIRRDDGIIPSDLPSSYRRAYKTIFNPRGINTSWAVITTTTTTSPPPPEPKKPLHPITFNPSAPPSPRVAFLFAQSLIVLCRYLSLSFFHQASSALLLLLAAPSSPPPDSSSTSSLLPWSTRTHLTLSFFLHNYLLLSSLHEICSLVFVSLLDLDEPHEWPPLYGSIQSAYTIRRFWSEFWHRGGYASLKGIGGGVGGWIWDVLYPSYSGSRNQNQRGDDDQKGELGRRAGDQAKRRGDRDGKGKKSTEKEKEKGKLSARKAVEISVAFAVSGLIQVVMGWKGGRCNAWASGEFYFVQPVGVVVEEVVMGVWGRIIRGRAAAKFGTKLGRMERAVGYLWVWGWFWWWYPRRTALEIECLRKALSV